MRLTRLFNEFFHSEKAGGLLLVGCTLISLLIANTAIGDSYIHFWHTNLGPKPVEFWVNDVLMSIFFLLVGLEIERELYIGEMSDLRRAMLPVFAAIGGMAVPALIHYLFNHGTASQGGVAIPMATDIAFSLGILSLLGNRVPAALKVFLTALAIIDDLGSILVIALFYAHGISTTNLLIAGGIYAVMLVLNKFKVYRTWIYLLLGVVMWVFMYRSGVHATITGVLVAAAIPFGNGDEHSPSYQLQHRLHKPVAFVILPIFALANTAIAIPATWMDDLGSPNSLGIMLGLLAGKPAGIFLFSMIPFWLGLASLPAGIKRVHLLWTGLLAGIGFTMSIFITHLAFADETLVVSSKIAIMLGSVTAGLLGLLLLKASLKQAADPLSEAETT
ncbi:Na+/H+ antiporter NhaA [Paraflavitalea sp. CAU 1676]|uniref:Na+/H+ antiporter NhaA n=1 Tax=Paraflavitalea sp. CAU 1676 TaxID=3032598 RepID=UPI0023DA0081|nr:Na+/H+ antiporter NhaA [Paraflavitalea sp. CAU 1676]MDF2188105.1 Na+/H+ antiporter NhaA [Paraflavitalea sp. CAU 1676]